MSLDILIADVEELEEDGAIILLKWDGERDSHKRPVIVQKPGSDYSFRRDTDDLAETLKAAIADYRLAFG